MPHDEPRALLTFWSNLYILRLACAQCTARRGPSPFPRWPRLLAMYPARFYTPLMNLVFNRKNGLGLNMVRYNIPAGHKPHLSPNVSENPLQAQGFRPDPLKPYNWSEDAAQIRVLKDSKAYGATVFEAISYSPPWWMTKSGIRHTVTRLSCIHVTGLSLMVHLLAGITV